MVSGTFLIDSVNAMTVSYITEDTWIFSYATGGQSGWNYEGNSTFLVGYNTGNRYGIVNMSITDLIEDYENGVVPDFVYLRLYGYLHVLGDYDLPIEIYRIISAWDNETITWNNQPSYSASNVSYYLMDGAIFSGSGNSGWIYIDITNDFIVNVLDVAGIDFYGYMLKGLYTDESQYASFSAEEQGSGIGSIYYSSEEEEEEENIITGDFLVNWFIYAVFLVVIPVAMTVYISNLGQQANPLLMLVTFLGSETLMSAISLSIGIIDIWFMLVIIIVDVLIILGLMKGRSG